MNTDIAMMLSTVSVFIRVHLWIIS